MIKVEIGKEKKDRHLGCACELLERRSNMLTIFSRDPYTLCLSLCRLYDVVS